MNDSRRVDGREIRTVVIDPDRVRLVQWAFEAYASGEWTIRTFTEALGAKGPRALRMALRFRGRYSPPTSPTCCEPLLLGLREV